MLTPEKRLPWCWFAPGVNIPVVADNRADAAKAWQWEGYWVQFFTALARTGASKGKKLTVSAKIWEDEVDDNYVFTKTKIPPGGCVIHKFKDSVLKRGDGNEGSLFFRAREFEDDTEDVVFNDDGDDTWFYVKEGVEVADKTKLYTCRLADDVVDVAPYGNIKARYPEKGSYDANQFGNNGEDGGDDEQYDGDWDGYGGACRYAGGVFTNQPLVLAMNKRGNPRGQKKVQNKYFMTFEECRLRCAQKDSSYFSFGRASDTCETGPKAYDTLFPEIDQKIGTNNEIWNDWCPAGWVQVFQNSLASCLHKSPSSFYDHWESTDSEAYMDKQMKDFMGDIWPPRNRYFFMSSIRWGASGNPSVIKKGNDGNEKDRDKFTLFGWNNRANYRDETGWVNTAVTISECSTACETKGLAGEEKCATFNWRRSPVCYALVTVDPRYYKEKKMMTAGQFKSAYSANNDGTRVPYGDGEKWEGHNTGSSTTGYAWTGSGNRPFTCLGEDGKANDNICKNAQIGRVVSYSFGEVEYYEGGEQRYDPDAVFMKPYMDIPGGTRICMYYCPWQLGFAKIKDSDLHDEAAKYCFLQMDLCEMHPKGIRRPGRDSRWWRPNDMTEDTKPVYGYEAEDMRWCHYQWDCDGWDDDHKFTHLGAYGSEGDAPGVDKNFCCYTSKWGGGELSYTNARRRARRLQEHFDAGGNVDHVDERNVQILQPRHRKLRQFMDDDFDSGRTVSSLDHILANVTKNTLNAAVEKYVASEISYDYDDIAAEFDEMDTDSDNIVSRAELRFAMRHHSDHMFANAHSYVVSQRNENSTDIRGSFDLQMMVRASHNRHKKSMQESLRDDNKEFISAYIDTHNITETLHVVFGDPKTWHYDERLPVGRSLYILKRRLHEPYKFKRRLHDHVADDKYASIPCTGGFCYWGVYDWDKCAYWEENDYCCGHSSDPWTPLGVCYLQQERVTCADETTSPGCGSSGRLRTAQCPYAGFHPDTKEYKALAAIDGDDEYKDRYLKNPKWAEHHILGATACRRRECECYCQTPDDGTCTQAIVKNYNLFRVHKGTNCQEMCNNDCNQGYNPVAVVAKYVNNEFCYANKQPDTNYCVKENGLVDLNGTEVETCSLFPGAGPRVARAEADICRNELNSTAKATCSGRSGLCSTHEECVGVPPTGVVVVGAGIGTLSKCSQTTSRNCYQANECPKGESCQYSHGCNLAPNNAFCDTFAVRPCALGETDDCDDQGMRKTVGGGDARCNYVNARTKAACRRSDVGVPGSDGTNPTWIDAFVTERDGTTGVPLLCTDIATKKMWPFCGHGGLQEACPSNCRENCVESGGRYYADDAFRFGCYIAKEGDPCPNDPVVVPTRRLAAAAAPPTARRLRPEKRRLPHHINKAYYEECTDEDSLCGGRFATCLDDGFADGEVNVDNALYASCKQRGTFGQQPYFTTSKFRNPPFAPQDIAHYSPPQTCTNMYGVDFGHRDNLEFSYSRVEDISACSSADADACECNDVDPLEDPKKSTKCKNPATEVVGDEEDELTAAAGGDERTMTFQCRGQTFAVPIGSPRFGGCCTKMPNPRGRGVEGLQLHLNVKSIGIKRAALAGRVYKSGDQLTIFVNNPYFIAFERAWLNSAKECNDDNECAPLVGECIRQGLTGKLEDELCAAQENQMSGTGSPTRFPTIEGGSTRRLHEQRRHRSAARVRRALERIRRMLNANEAVKLPCANRQIVSGGECSGTDEDERIGIIASDAASSGLGTGVVTAGYAVYKALMASGDWISGKLLGTPMKVTAWLKNQGYSLGVGVKAAFYSILATMFATSLPAHLLRLRQIDDILAREALPGAKQIAKAVIIESTSETRNKDTLIFEYKDPKTNQPVGLRRTVGKYYEAPGGFWYVIEADGTKTFLEKKVDGKRGRDATAEEWAWAQNPKKKPLNGKKIYLHGELGIWANKNIGNNRKQLKPTYRYENTRNFIRTEVSDEDGYNGLADFEDAVDWEGNSVAIQQHQRFVEEKLKLNGHTVRNVEHDWGNPLKVLTDLDAQDAAASADANDRAKLHNLRSKESLQNLYNEATLQTLAFDAAHWSAVADNEVLFSPSVRRDAREKVKYLNSQHASLEAYRSGRARLHTLAASIKADLDALVPDVSFDDAKPFWKVYALQMFAHFCGTSFNLQRGLSRPAANGYSSCDKTDKRWAADKEKFANELALGLHKHAAEVDSMRHAIEEARKKEQSMSQKKL